MVYLGDFLEDATLHFMWNTTAAAGESITRTTNGEVRVYKDNGVGQSTAGVTDTEDFDSLTGVHVCTIDLSADAFYAIGANYTVALQGATIDGKIVNAALAHFSIENRFAEVDVTKISGDSTAADNLELQFDGTGITGDEFPATQHQLDDIALTGSAVNTAAESYVLTTGTQSSGTVSNVVALDGTNHEHTDTAGAMDLYYQFDVAGDGVPTSVTMTGYLNSNNDDLEVLAFNWGGSTWDRIGTLNGKNSSSNDVHIFTLFTSHVGTGANLGKVRIRFDDGAFTLTSATLAVDQIFVSFAVVRRTVGYANGAIWINTNASNTNTESFVDGTADNPVSTLAAALTLSSNVNLTRFVLVNGSSITLTANSDNHSYFGESWTLALGGQSIVGIHIFGATISGTGIGTGTNQTMQHCVLNACTWPAETHLERCGIAATQTLGATGDLFMDNCHTALAGSTPPSIDMGSGLGASDAHIRHHSGALEFQNILSGDEVDLDGVGAVTLNVNCTGGTLNLTGHFTVTDNAGGSVTVNDDARFAEPTDVNLIQIDGLATSGNNATLNLKQLNIVNSAGDAIIASATGSNGDGIAASGNGSGHGILSTGGATGHGISSLGGATSGDGFHTEAATEGDGLQAVGAGAGKDINAVQTDNLDATVSSRATPAQVATEILDALDTDTYAELASIPGATTTLRNMIQFAFQVAKNKIDESGSAQQLYKNDDSTVLGTAVTSDLGGLATRGKFT